MKVVSRILGLAALSMLALTATPHAAKADGYCREYTRNVVIGGREQEAYGTACRGPDGQWRITSEDVGGQPAPQQAQAVDNTVVIRDSQPQVVYVDDAYPDYYYRQPYYAEPPVVFGFNYWGGHDGYYHGGYGGGYHGGYGGYHH